MSERKLLDSLVSTGKYFCTRKVLASTPKNRWNALPCRESDPPRVHWILRIQVFQSCRSKRRNR